MGSLKQIRRFATVWLALILLFTSQSIQSVARQREVTSVADFDFPSLLDADLEQLSFGLKSGIFTSVDLVNASLMGQ